jgi:hypothetical protein
MKDIHFAIVDMEHELSRHHEVTVDDYPGPVATALLGWRIHENPPSRNSTSCAPKDSSLSAKYLAREVLGLHDLAKHE